jgi:hypothetical protein
VAQYFQGTAAKLPYILLYYPALLVWFTFRLVCVCVEPFGHPLVFSTFCDVFYLPNKLPYIITYDDITNFVIHFIICCLSFLARALHASTGWKK